MSSKPPAIRVEDSLQFSRWYHEHLLWRIKWISVLLLLTYPYFYFVDFYQMDESAPARYRTVMIATHLLCAAVSALFLLMHRQLKFHWTGTHERGLFAVIQVYTALYLLSASVSSWNSQLLNGNVDAYIIIVLGISVLVPIHPKRFALFVAVNHILFLFLLYSTDQDRAVLLSKQINTTATAAIAIFIVWIFYQYMTREFVNQRRLKESEQKLRKLFAVNPFPLVLSRLSDGKILLINLKASQFFDLFSKRFESVDAAILFPDESSREEIVEELKRSGSVKNRVCQLNVSPTSGKWVMINYEAFEYEGEACVLTGITDITELKKIEYELEKHATTDPLTDVPNRGHGMAMLEKKIAGTGPDDALTVCFADINDLKLVNDRYGHAVGDEMIVEASRMLSSRLGPNDFLFRYGGDEFILVFGRTKEETLAVWERLACDLEEVNDDEDRPYSLSISYGLFAYRPGEGISVKDMIERADHEMYKHKRQHKKR